MSYEKAMKHLTDIINKIAYSVYEYIYFLNHKDQNSILTFPARIECTSPLESWMVQRRLKKMGIMWEMWEDEWDFRHRMWLVLCECTKGPNTGKAYLAWTTQREFVQDTDITDMPLHAASEILKEVKEVKCLN